MKEEREEKKVIDAGKRKKEVRLAAELLRWQCITAEPRQGREAHALQAPPGFSAAIWPVKRVQYHGGYLSDIPSSYLGTKCFYALPDEHWSKSDPLPVVKLVLGACAGLVIQTHPTRLVEHCQCHVLNYQVSSTVWLWQPKTKVKFAPG